jgi:tRNA(Ile2) C34 agmatinyltransferase TiaS
MDEDYDFWDIVKPVSKPMPVRLRSKHALSSAQCPKCGSFDTREGRDGHGRYWRCRNCKLILSEK